VGGRSCVFSLYGGCRLYFIIIFFFFCGAEASETSSLPVSGCPQILASARG